MKSNYEDIYMVAAEGDFHDPVWYDENGCPRFVAFNPELCPDIYAQEVILLEIACQNCHKKFMVQMSSWSWHKGRQGFGERMTLYLKDKRPGAFTPMHYGDPPRHDCIGDTENCYDLRVVEFWVKSDLTNKADERWTRHPEFEVKFEDIPEEEQP
jgi:hypothetical protein